MLSISSNDFNILVHFVVTEVVESCQCESSRFGNDNWCSLESKLRLSISGWFHRQRMDCWKLGNRNGRGCWLGNRQCGGWYEWGSRFCWYTIQLLVSFNSNQGSGSSFFGSGTCRECQFQRIGGGDNSFLLFRAFLLLLCHLEMEEVKTADLAQGQMIKLFPSLTTAPSFHNIYMV